MQQKHEFAFYWSELSSFLTKTANGDTSVVIDGHLYKRVVHVLRFKEGQEWVIFDAHVHSRVRLVAITKKHLEIRVLQRETIHFLAPAITVFLPILKREAFEEALYSCVELGANEIQLIITEKTQRAFGGNKEIQRINNIMIAAAEQSKQFAIPLLHHPITLQESFDPSLPIICCSIEGRPAGSLVEYIQSQSAAHYGILVGPEGDFTQQEHDYIQKHAVLLCALTPTILRTQQALVVMLGMVRSLLRTF